MESVSNLFDTLIEGCSKGCSCLAAWHAAGCVCESPGLVHGRCRQDLFRALHRRRGAWSASSGARSERSEWAGRLGVLESQQIRCRVARTPGSPGCSWYAGRGGSEPELDYPIGTPVGSYKVT